MKRVAIVGGGVAGLALAHALLKREPRGDVVVLEASERPGGNLRSEATAGYLCEWGANGFQDSVPETLALVRDLGLEERLQPSADQARRRFLYRKGRLHELPGGPQAFLRSGLLSWTGKLRLALEPFAGERPPGDETIHAFAARRLGREAADVLIDAMVRGVFAGDSRRLSLQACFPGMWQMETQHGGLLRALFAALRARRVKRGDALGSPVGRLTSFKDGIEELIHGLLRALGPRLRTRARVLRLEEQDGRYGLVLAGGEVLRADAVALCAGARASAGAVEALDGELADVLGEIETAPVAVVCLGYELSSLPRPLDGFGFLVPRGEGPRVLGVLWDSSIYPGRAPAGRALLRAMLGGACDPQAVELDDEALLAAVHRDLAVTMGLTAAPAFVRVIRHHVGIPQYTVGHLGRLTRIDDALARHPRLFAGGNAYRGVAINNCVAEAGPLAERVLAALREQAGAAA